jgi:hypothetical protein
MPVMFQKLIQRDDLKKNLNVLFLFGDNDARRGMGGQAAEMRNEPNAVGIRTKVAPGRSDSDFWSDRAFNSNCAKIEEDLVRVRHHLRRGGIVVIPTDGIGTNRAEMEKRCPKTFYVLQQSLASLDSVPVTMS